MNNSKLEMLLAIHDQFVKASHIPEGNRPFSIASNLTKIQELIMKESAAPVSAPAGDDIPF